MLELINQFFSRESELRNITIDQLLEENHIDCFAFWSYVRNYDMTIQRKIKIGIQLNKNQIVQLEDKIKLTTKKRKNNQELLDIYHLLKQEKLTFGDVARIKGCSPDRVYHSLQNEYLTKIQGFSYEKMLHKNMQLLKQKNEYKMYFYFLEHNVTFQELTSLFSLDEAEVIYYFDSVIAEELSNEQIKQIFYLNKKRERKREQKNQYQLREQELCNLFALTEEEIEQIDSIIASFQKKINLDKEDSIYQQYKNIITTPVPTKHIELLTYMKQVLSFKNCKLDFMEKNNLDRTLNANWITTILKKQILMKFAIINIIKSSCVCKRDETNYMLIKQHLSLYANHLNQSNHIEDGATIDKQCDTNIFSKIEKVIQKENVDKELMGKEKEILEYYKSHFILLRDLSPLFEICVKDYVQDLKENHKKIWWDQINKTEKRRQKKIKTNIQKLFSLSQLMIEHQTCIENKDSVQKAQLEQELLTSMGEQYDIAFKKTQSHIKTLIQAAQFTGIYLYQDIYTVNELEKLFGIKGHSSAYRRLFHPSLVALLDPEIIQYIKTKRAISERLHSRRNGREMDHKVNGQFVKKYQPISNEE